MNRFRILQGVIFLFLLIVSAYFLELQFKKRKNDQNPNVTNITISNKIHPDLADWLKTAADNDSIKISLWIKENTIRPESTRPPPDQIRSPQETDEFFKKVDNENAERVKKTIAPVVERLSDLGYISETDTSAPSIFITATKKFIFELASWDEISSIDRGDRIGSPL